MFQIVKKAIDEYNMYGLLPEAPSDEFDIESKKITEQININSTVEEIAEIIARVFSRAFNVELEVKEFMATAQKIQSGIQVNNI